MREPIVRLQCCPLVLASLLASLPFVAGCDAPPANAGAQQDRAAPEIGVEVLELKAQPAQPQLQVPAELLPFETVQITAAVPGIVTRVLFEPGTEVQQGQILAELRGDEFGLKAQQARAAVTKAEAVLREAEDALSRRLAARAVRAQLVSDESVVSWQTRNDVARAELAQARALRATAELAQQQAIVRAPRRGVMQARTVQQGQYLAVGATLGTLVQPTPLRVQFSVPAAAAHLLHRGMRVQFSVPPAVDRHDAEIRYVAATAESPARHVQVQAIADGALSARPGMFARAWVTPQIQDCQLLVPSSALASSPSGSGFHVYVVHKAIAYSRAVQLGGRQGDWVNISDGLSPGDWVVTQGAETLYEGAAGARGGDSAEQRPEHVRFTEACIRRPVLAWVLTLGVMLAGVLALGRMGVSQAPESEAPTLQITLEWPGASPEEIERDLINVAEDALMQVQGLQHIVSVSQTATAQITLELDLDTPVDAAVQDAQMRLAAAERRFPQGVRPPIISKSSTADAPVMWFLVTGPLPPRQLSDVVRQQLKGALQGIPGVGQVQLFGQRTRQVRIWVDAERLQQHRLSVDDVVRALTEEHVSLPAGLFTSSAQHVGLRVSGEAETLAALADMPVRSPHTPGRSGLRLGDVAAVEDGVADEDLRARLDGVPAQGIGLKKQRGANVVRLAAQARDAVEQVQKQLPAGVRIDTLYDASRNLQHTLRALAMELLLAVVLTALVCRVFLGTWQSAVSVFWALPMSLLGACAVMACCGFTLNGITVLALTVAVGLVLDDAIMVLESIHRQYARGRTARQSAIRGTRRVLTPALASTLGMVVIFAPVVAMEGRTARDFLEFGVTVSVAVLLSLLEALTLAPARTSQLLSRRNGHTAPRRGWEEPIRRSLTAAWEHPRWTAFCCLCVCVAAAGAFWQVRRLPPAVQDSDLVRMQVQTVAGTPLEQTAAATLQVEKALGRIEGVRQVLTLVGDGGGSHTATFYVMLQPSGTRPPRAMITPQLDAAVRSASQLHMSQTATGSLELELYGGDWPKLQQAAQQLHAALPALPAVRSADYGDALMVPELRLVPDRQRCQDSGVSMEHLARAVRALVGGLPVGKFSLEGRRVDIVLRLRADQRQNPDDLHALTLRGTQGDRVALGELATLQERRVLQQLTRVDRQRQLTLRVHPHTLQDLPKTRTAIRRLAAQELPPGVHLRFGGDEHRRHTTEHSLWQAMLLGVVLATMVLAVQFNGLRLPLLVLSLLPVAAAGAALLLAATGQPLSENAWLGAVLLFGLVKKNAIVLLDSAERWRLRGLAPAHAAKRAARRRLRPIVMTSVATSVAMLPAALGIGPSGTEHRGLAVVVVGGVALSTVLCLVVLPLAYARLWRLRRKSRRRSGAAARTAARATECLPPRAGVTPRVKGPDATASRHAPGGHAGRGPATPTRPGTPAG